MRIDIFDVGVIFFKGIDSLFIYIQYERDYKIHLLDKKADINEIVKNGRSAEEGKFIPLSNDELAKVEERIFHLQRFYRPTL